NNYRRSGENVLVLGEEEGKYFKEEGVGREDVLVGVGIEKEGMGSKILGEFNVMEDDIGEEIEAFRGYGTSSR
ncbi:hypothetical protein, partial [Leuconostoc mesenteroides]|uniref:hypothetical protein n=1 Tax=Leuconostoc mesenteroides TaxID=1245 RepID=UPI001642CE38